MSGNRTERRDAKGVDPLRLLPRIDRAERALRAVLAILLLLLVLFQFMPFSPSIRAVISDADRIEGVRLEP